MIKGLVAFVICLMSFSSFACDHALPTDDVNFCSSFKSVAPCYCTSSGVPANMCQDMNVLYQRMISMFGSLQRACNFQRYTSPQDCIDNWNCYRMGGIDSRGRLCSSTQKACS